MNSLDGDLTGKKIGEYELLTQIGVGGMGVVYEGRHPLIGKRVAIKFLLPSFSKDPEAVGRFLSEARAVNAIGHRGIVDIFNFGKLEDGTQYFVMEFLEGRAFDEIVRQEAPAPPALVTRWLEEICDALGAAHAAGVIHRDIKPSNLFLVETGRTRPYVKVLDFGIAKLGAPKSGTTPQTRQSMVIGTPEYIAPEQAQGRAVGAQTDLYAIGCVAFELLTGKLPFQGENPLDTMFKHVMEPTPRVSALAPTTPAALDELVFHLMQKRPEERPESAGAVLARLEGLRGHPTRPSINNTQHLATAGAPIPLSQVAEPKAELDNGATPAPLPADSQLARAVRPQNGKRAAMGVGGAVMVGGLAWALWPSTPAPQPAEQVMPAPKLAVTLPLVIDAGAALEAPVDAGFSTAEALAEPLVIPKPKPAPLPQAAAKKGFTAAQVQARITALERKLEQREAARGEVIPVLRTLLKQAKRDAQAAQTPEARREVMSFLDDVSRQVESR
ncbi:MAG: protein kinase [Myxococcaceae bacterium]|nr:protein kinase [Myxococcaceae bacterium]